MTLQQKIGKRIKELRTIRNDYSQEQLSNLVGCDRAYLSRVESGKQNITMESLNSFCNALNITLKDFFSNFDIKYECEDYENE
ncbi:MAG TPA: XRE family transcriptional regulator [Firmicutes bacterium]|nr:XRE family transcriptional regulator [Bacillota bacterium]